LSWGATAAKSRIAREAKDTKATTATGANGRIRLGKEAGSDPDNAGPNGEPLNNSPSLPPCQLADRG
jgi:hypothetical protein